MPKYTRYPRRSQNWDLREQVPGTITRTTNVQPQADFLACGEAEIEVGIFIVRSGTSMLNVTNADTEVNGVTGYPEYGELKEQGKYSQDENATAYYGGFIAVKVDPANVPVADDVLRVSTIAPTVGYLTTNATAGESILIPRSQGLTITRVEGEVAEVHLPGKLQYTT